MPEADLASKAADLDFGAIHGRIDVAGLAQVPDGQGRQVGAAMGLTMIRFLEAGHFAMRAFASPSSQADGGVFKRKSLTAALRPCAGRGLRRLLWIAPLPRAQGSFRDIEGGGRILRLRRRVGCGPVAVQRRSCCCCRQRSRP